MYFSKSANGKYVTKVEGDNITLSNGNGLSAFYYKVNLQDLSKNYGISYITSNSSPYRLTADYLSDSTKQSTDLNMPLSSNIIAVSTSYAANGDLYIMYASDSAGNPPFKYYVLKKGETTQQLISSGIPVS